MMDLPRILRCLGLACLVSLPLAGASGDESTSEARADVVRMLSARHPPGCGAVMTRLGEDADTVLVSIAEADSPIPWVPVRAAACLATRPAAERAVARWLDTPSRRGLVSTVLDRLDLMPLDRATRIADHVLASPRGASFHVELGASRIEAIRARVP